MNAWQAETAAWNAYRDHTQACAQCYDQTRPVCEVGEKLRHTWILASNVVERAEQEADAVDCATESYPDGERFRPWSPEL